MKEEKKTAEKLPLFQRLLLLSFVEGSCVMVAELAGGKMLAPYYGTSLYVWASTLAITLGGLTIGYYVGGRLSAKTLEERKKALFYTLAAASALVMVMPVWANFIMLHTLDLEFLTGVVISQLCFLLPPIFGMGMVSPLIISLIGETRNSGTAAGSVYAISTLGGVIATLVTGFWLVPVVGISMPCIVVGGLLFLLSVLVLFPGNKLVALLLPILIAPSFLYVQNAGSQGSDTYNVLYYSEGMLGQVKVVEFKINEKYKSLPTRCMLVNHNWQTWVQKDNPAFSFLYYTHFTNTIISHLPAGSRALLIGLGGGTVANQLERKHIAYDAVEIDGRLPELAKKYFGLKGNGNIYVDDGRHYINKCKQKYDLVIIDALLGENVPSHLLSIECFESVKKLLTPNGKLFIEFDGIEESDKGIAQQMVYNSIIAAGFHCQTFASIAPEQNGDIMYLASAGSVNDFDTASVNGDFYYAYNGPMKQFKTTLALSTTGLVTDNKPVLDYYLRNRMVHFRNELVKKQNQAFIEDNMPFYY